MNKRKIMLVAVALCMVAILGFGGTLAYLTDTETAKNVFTVGDIDITLIEEQRKDVTDGSLGVEDFVDDKILLPIVGSAQGDKETITVANGDVTVNVPDYDAAKNWVDKIVNVRNTSSSEQPAYVRVLFAFPADADDANSAANMLMHWNHDGSETAGNWDRQDSFVTVTLDEIKYNVYTYTYQHKLIYNEVTDSPAITGVYIDSRVDATTDAAGNITYSFTDGNGKTHSMTFSGTKGPKLYVVAQGVQAAGFEDKGANYALDTAFGTAADVVDAETGKTNAQTWFETVTD